MPKDICGFGRETGESWESNAPVVEEKEGGLFKWFWREFEVFARGWGFEVIVADAIWINVEVEEPYEERGRVMASPRYTVLYVSVMSN